MNNLSICTLCLSETNMRENLSMTNIAFEHGAFLTKLLFYYIVLFELIHAKWFAGMEREQSPLTQTPPQLFNVQMSQMPERGNPIRRDLVI
jgi:hypothetical protein